MTHRRPQLFALVRRTTGAVLAGAAAACGGGATSGAEPDAAAAAGGGGGARAVMSPPSAVLVDDLNDARQVGPRDAARLLAARVDGDTLRLTAEYGGGCRRHVFRLAVSRAFRESFPVQAGAVLGHDAGGDPCRALVRSDLAVSLAPVADAYRAAYGTRAGVVVVVLDGAQESVRYTFR